MGKGELKFKFAKILMGSSLDEVIKEKVTTSLKEAAASTTKENEDIGWTRITARNIKDFNPTEQHKMQKIAYYLYDKNGLGHRIIERTKDFVVGDGLTYDIKDAKVKEVIDEHWEINQWAIKQADRIGELGIYGEQFYPVFIAKQTGLVRLGYVDPEFVVKVSTHPENAALKISYKAAFRDSTSKSFTIIRIDHNPSNKTFGFLNGESFFFSINTVENMPRGRSDLFTIADSIDSYENFLYNRAERADILNRIIYDLLMEGLDEKEIKERLKGFKIPRSNEVFGHNEKTSLNIKVPDLGSQDASSEAKLLFNHIMGGSGFGPHWFGFAEGIVRATALAMDLPTKKQLKSRQKVFKFMISFIFRHQVHQAVLAKRLNADQKDTPIQINLPMIEEKDTEAISRALVAITDSLVVGTTENWITTEEATKVYRFILAQIGIEISKTTKIPPLTESEQEEVDKILKKIYEKKKLNIPKVPTEEEEEERREEEKVENGSK